MLLSFGDDVADAFNSAAALRVPPPRGPRAGLAANRHYPPWQLAFVSTFFVGAVVTLIAAPFGTLPASFARGVFFYLSLVAATGLFNVYLSTEIFLQQAVGLVLF